MMFALPRFRPVSALTVLVALLVTGTVYASAPLPEGLEVAPVAVKSTVSPHTTSLVLGNTAADATASAPLGCLVALPRNARTASAVLKSGVADGVSVSRVMTMRGRPVALLRVDGARGNEVAVEVTHDGDWQAESAYNRFASRGMTSVLGTSLPAAKAMAIGSGSYVIVHAPAFTAAVAPLADWKTRKGLRVVTVSTDVTGPSTAGIKAWLQDAYDTWEYPPEHIVLVGDIGAIPTFSFEGNPSDLGYVLLDGDDFLPDAMLGRLPVENDTEARTVVNKTIAYERTPYTDDPGWFTRSLMVAGLTGSTTPPHTVNFCGEQLQSLGFTPPLTVTSPVPHPPLLGAQLVKQHVDTGVSMLVYRGWAYGSAGWDPPVFTVTEIPALNNGNMLPVVMSFVCLTGDYTASAPCFGEVFLRQGTPEDPGKGAVAFIGNGEHWSHTRYNDAMAISVFERITDPGLTDLGSLLNAGKMRFADYFPNEFDAATHGEESVEFYFHIYNLMGDPELNYWRGAPIAATAQLPASLSAGENSLAVSLPVAGARIGVVQDGHLIGAAYTDAQGDALVALESVVAGPAVEVTITGASLLPIETSLATSTAAVFVAASDGAVQDGVGGNGDGLPNPGESFDLVLNMTNDGSAASGAFSVFVDEVQGSASATGQADFASLAAGAEGTAQTNLAVTLDADAADGEVVTLVLEADRGPGNIDVSVWQFAVQAPQLQPLALTATAGVIEPGASSPLLLTLRNDGSLSTTGGTVTLSLVDADGATVTGASATFGACAPEAVVTTATGLAVDVDATTAVGTNLNFVAAIATDEGYTATTSGAVTVGAVDLTSPVGPDAHGYYAYDSADLDYVASRPRYQWQEISTAFGGAGTKLDFSMPDNLGTSVQVDLPFSFRYYGQDYSRIRVCDNGWLSFDLDTNYNFYNWTLPSVHGNDALVAPFWDNLNPEIPGAGDENPYGIDPDGIYWYHDTVAGAFIVEWSRIPFYKPEILGLQTFQAVLLDPAVHTTASGDGEILFYYRHVTNNDYIRMYATAGWESPDGTDGIQLTYANENAPGMVPLQSGLAVRVTTEPPVRVPFALAALSARPEGASVRLDWEPADDRPVLGWHVDRVSPSGTERLTAVPLAADARTFSDPRPSGEKGVRYSLQALHPWQSTSRPGETAVAGSAPTRIALRAAWPNPAPGETALGFALPRSGSARLRVYDVAGRLVRTLVDGTVAAGEEQVVWDGRDDAGNAVAGGVYFYRLEAEVGIITRKLTLVR